MSAPTHTPVDLTDEQRPKPARKFKYSAPYIVWSPEGSTAPVVAHTTHGQALAVAHMMAKRHPGQTFRVMQNASRPIMVDPAAFADALAALNAETNEMVALSNGRLG